MRPIRKHLYVRLLGHVRPYWRVFALSVAAMIVQGLVQPVLPMLLKPLLDGSFVHRDPHVIQLSAILVVVVFLVRGLASYTSSVALAWVEGKLILDLRVRMFERLVAFPQNYYDHHPSGVLISKLTFNVTQLTDAATNVLTVIVRDSLAVIGLLAWMFYLDWKLTLITLAMSPLIVLIVKRLGGRLRQMSRNLQQSMGNLTHVLEETIGGQQIVRLFGGQNFERTRFAKTANWTRRFQFKFTSAQAASAPAAQLIAAVALATVIYVVAYRSLAGEITVGAFVSYFAAMGMLLDPLKRLTAVNGRLQKGLAAAESVFELVDEVPERDTGTRIIESAAGRLEFRDLSFTYEGTRTPAVTDISATVAPGETVALVGPSGAGKSTLANLIPRFYNPTEGQILLDGIDTATLTLSSLRRNIALVSQDIVLFNDTVRANIAYGPLSDASEAAIVDAATKAHAIEFIRELPEDLDTLIGENGVRLSGGQRQRLAIARAFLKDAPVLILDEATSSLDSESERHIQAAIGTLRHARTTIIIAHRLSTIEKAHRILVMAEGHIVESGTHKSLLSNRNSLYAGLYRFQFSEQTRPETPQLADAN